MDWKEVEVTVGHNKFEEVEVTPENAPIVNAVLQDIQRWVNILGPFEGVFPFKIKDKYDIALIDFTEDTSNTGVVDSGVHIVFQLKGDRKKTVPIDMLPPPGFPQKHYASASILLQMARS